MSEPSLRSHQRPSRRKDSRHEDIVHAALELFVERGYASTRLDDVAAAAGVSKGTLYLYFTSKEALFKAVVREGLVSRLEELGSLIDNHAGSTLELLRKLLLGWWTSIGSSRLAGIPKLVLAEARNFPEIAAVYLDDVVLPAQQALARLIKQGIDRGEIRPMDPMLASQLLTAPVLLMSLWQKSLDGCGIQRVDPLALIEAHIETFSRGVAAVPGEAP